MYDFESAGSITHEPRVQNEKTLSTVPNEFTFVPYHCEDYATKKSFRKQLNNTIVAETRQNQYISCFLVGLYACFNFTCYYGSRANAGKSPLLQVRGWGNASRGLVSEDREGGKSKISSLCPCKARHPSVDTMAPDSVEKYLQGKSPEFAGDWLEIINRSKLKPTVEGTHVRNCCFF